MNAVILRMRTGDTVELHYYAVDSVEEFKQMSEDYSYPKWSTYWEAWVFRV